ncbi:hypothetical protein BDZ89DRAFT_1060999 [Hymenopellis radicata]|nr:hypothetical protein BDZ89DRAFT_1060999 [Hymenopellis radicata]
MFADLPTSSTVRSPMLSLVRSLSAGDVAHVSSAYQNLSSLEVSRCNMDYEDPSVTPTAQYRSRWRSSACSTRM